jgi:hypothetical protein
MRPNQKPGIFEMPGFFAIAHLFYGENFRTGVF